MRVRIRLLSTVSALALVGAAGLSDPASAADLPVRPVVKAPTPAVDSFSWTGFYVGLHGGFGWLDHKQTTSDTNGTCDPDFINDVSHCSLKPTGGVFGGFVGYNWQTPNKIIVGIEADGSWTGLDKSEVYDNVAALPGSIVTVRGEVEWLASVRGRLGMAFSPTMIYVTGGVAFAGIKSGWATDSIPPFGVQLDKTKVGWVVGGGIEHAFNKMWSLRAEVLHHDLGKDHGSAFSAGTTYASEFRHTVTVARAGLALRW
jgi:outer membrane immunogenic protein